MEAVEDLRAFEDRSIEFRDDRWQAKTNALLRYVGACENFRVGEFQASVERWAAAVKGQV